MPDQLPVKQWSHIVIRVTDIERSLEFYRTCLGFDTVFDVQLEGGGFQKILGGRKGVKGRMVCGRVGGQRVELIQYEGLPPAAPAEKFAPGLSGFTLQIEDAQKALEICKRNGIPYETEPIEIYGYHQFFIRDPDGVYIELTQYPEGLGPDSG